MSIELKIKVKHLAEESRIIRKETNKAKAEGATATVNNLHNHRTQVVRPAARNTLIAYGYIRGTPYSAMEANAKTSPNWKEVNRLINRYSDNDLTIEVLKDWAA